MILTELLTLFLSRISPPGRASYEQTWKEKVVSFLSKKSPETAWREPGIRKALPPGPRTSLYEETRKGNKADSYLQYYEETWKEKIGKGICGLTLTSQAWKTANEAGLFFCKEEEHLLEMDLVRKTKINLKKLLVLGRREKNL